MGDGKNAEGNGKSCVGKGKIGGIEITRQSLINVRRKIIKGGWWFETIM